MAAPDVVENRSVSSARPNAHSNINGCIHTTILKEIGCCWFVLFVSSSFFLVRTLAVFVGPFDSPAGHCFCVAR